MNQKTSPLTLRSKVAIAGFLVGGIVIGGAVGPAFAGQGLSSVSQVNLDGVVYYNQAVINTRTAYAYSVTLSQRHSGATAQAGWIGANARLFRASNDAEQCESGFVYSTSSNQVVNPTSCADTSSNINWYSYGVVSLWNGNGYNPYYTYRSPNQSS